jgi:alkylation response protein AidB-like acyl-CoA dehydrogenase
VDLLPSPEQLEIGSSSASFLAASLPIGRSRQLIGEASNIDSGAWAQAAELGWFGLGLPESEGGVGGTLADEALLFREIGRGLAGGPFLSTVLAARVASFGGRSDLAASIVAGAPVGLVLPGRQATVGRDAIRGQVQLLDAVGAEVVLAAGPEEAGLFAVADLGPLAAIECIDPTSRLARVEVDSAAPTVTVPAHLDPVEGRGLVLVAAMHTGIAEATRDIAAAHAVNRVQFDRPIGVNQAVKHPCADMAVRSELAWAQTIVAALAIDEGREDAELQALTAKVVAADAADRNAAATIQILGGMGFTFEHDANLFVKRAFVLDHVFGDEREALSRLIDLPAAV